MPEDSAPAGILKQHLIDPEICIRCNTCEATCPVGAITHDDTNYVVDASICNFCMDCIAPCPTGSIDNWRMVKAAWTIEEQFGWEELPAQAELGGDAAVLPDAVEDEVGALLAAAHSGVGGKAVAPSSAAKPFVNIFRRARPAIATIQGNFRITDAETDSDIHHIVLAFGETHFPFLEGQSIGIVPPGSRPDGNRHDIRLYSIASGREGEKPSGNNLALTVKRVPGGLASNYMCDLNLGDKVEVTGPFGATFLMPNANDANVLMICTGTGSAPFRAFTEQRRRTRQEALGRYLLFFGARTPQELPYFGPLQKLPDSLLEKHLVFSRIPSKNKEYVQDRIRTEGRDVAELLKSPKTYIYICGLKGMEGGVDEALTDVCCHHQLDWSALKPEMRSQGRFHVETY